MRRKNNEIEKIEEMHHDESNWLVSYADMMTLLFGFFVLLYSFSSFDNQKFELVSKEVAKHFGGNIKEDPRIVNMKVALDSILQSAGLEQGVEVASKYSSITLKFDGEILFKSGSAELVPDMQVTMNKIITALKKQNKIKSVKVEGHTDDVPIMSAVFPTNWELSSARSSRIVRQFEAAGFESKILVAEGFGSSRPIKPNIDESGLPNKANRKANRRVLIAVEFNDDYGAVKTALNDKNFKQPDVEKRIAEQVDNSIDPELPFEEQMNIRKHKAKMKLKMAQEQLREAQSKVRERKRKEAALNRVKQMEMRAYEAERKAKEMMYQNTSPPRKPANRTDEPLSLKEGLKQLDQ